MAHNLNFNELKGKHYFSSVIEKAWHGLGLIAKGYTTSAEALKFAGHDHTVTNRKLLLFDNENEASNEGIKIKIPEIEVPNFYAIIRIDNDTAHGLKLLKNRGHFYGNFFNCSCGVLFVIVDIWQLAIL